MYNVITVKEELNESGQDGKEKVMDEMNMSELLVEQTEEKMIYRFLLIIAESKDKEEIEEKVKALLIK